MTSKMAKLTAIAAMFLLHSPAQGSGKRFIWIVSKTDEGCLIHWSLSPSTTKADWDKTVHFSWSGSQCQKGQFVEGEGTLTMRRDDKDPWNAAARSRLTGRMVEGVFDGPVHTISTDGDGAHDWGTDDIVMGCQKITIAQGTCTPRKRLHR